ncbi:MAG: GGDEF domain-containing phosphodiesterase [Pseudomonadota bacterium]
MHISAPGSWKTAVSRILTFWSGPQAVLFASAIMLSAYWLGGEIALLGAALGLPLALLALSALPVAPLPAATSAAAQQTALTQAIGRAWAQTAGGELQSAILCLEFDEYADVQHEHGQRIADVVTQRLGERMQTVLRGDDMIVRTSDSRFTILMGPARLMDLEACIQLAARLQSAAEEPVVIDGLTLHCAIAIGFCLRGRAPGNDPDAWRAAAETALTEARRLGPNMIRAFSAEMQVAKAERVNLRSEAAAALESGQIQPWFQPQISTDTGRITGFECLARWVHSERGVIMPNEFLPALEETGLLERLAEVMLYHTLTAVKAWDAAGIKVPQVGVNFSTQELNNPRLVDKVAWELDRFELTADRLAVEILETVVTSDPEDMVCRNIAGLAELGCRIDLDDFGTGSASIAAIRRFAVGRIKIDRTFVMRADRDPEQQRMVSAILTMAERLRVETLAEGVESVGEHTLLAQLGCDHVQGFGIGKPMPFEQTMTWVRAHEAKLMDTPELPGRKLS